MSQKRPAQKRPTQNRSATARTNHQKPRGKLRVGVIAPIVLTAAVIGAVLVLHFSSSSSSSTGSGSSASVNPRMGTAQAVGLSAPDGTFTTITGQKLSVASLQGKPTLIWFVSTWCSSCQAGTQAMAGNVSKLSSDGVRVVEVELYKDLGQSGPGMTAFAKALAGNQYANPDWIFAKSSKGLTQAYDPKSYLDIYYLINSRGQITYVNGSPGSTMTSLLSQAAKIT